MTLITVMGRLVSTLSPIVLLPLLSKTFHHKCITLVTSNKQLTKWRGEEWRRLLSGGTLPVQVSRLYRPDQLNLNDHNELEVQVLLLSHQHLVQSLADSGQCAKLVWVEEEDEGDILLRQLDRLGSFCAS